MDNGGLEVLEAPPPSPFIPFPFPVIVPSIDNNQIASASVTIKTVTTASTTITAGGGPLISGCTIDQHLQKQLPGTGEDVVYRVDTQ